MYQTSLFQLIQEVDDKQTELHDAVTYLEKNRTKVESDLISTVQKLKNSLTAKKSDFKTQLANTFIAVRSGKRDIADIGVLMSKFRQEQFQPNKIEKSMEPFFQIKPKIDEIIEWEKAGVIFIGQTDNMPLVMDGISYLMYTSGKDQSIKDSFRHFLKRESDKSTFFWIDVPRKECGDKVEIIEKRLDGRVCQANILSRQSSLCLIEWPSNASFCGERMVPKNVIDVELKCPGSGSNCSPVLKLWHCKICKSTIKFEKTQKLFYCIMCEKKFEPIQAGFQCNDLYHDLDFYLTFDNLDQLDYYLQVLGGEDVVPQIDRNENKHLVVIGSTGTGKSTLCNVLSGRRHNDAKFFPVSDSMESCTNKTTLKTVKWRGKDFEFNLIDTPGLNDPEPGRDKLNQKEMVEELTKLGHINVFLIVVNGSNPRFDHALIKMINLFIGMFGKDFLERNTVFEFSNWSYDTKSIKRRGPVKNEDFWTKAFNQQLGEHLGSSSNVPTVFIDALFDPTDELESKRFEDEMSKLKDYMQSFQPFFMH